MARGINKIKNIIGSLMNILHLDCMTLNGDSPLSFQIHIIQNLCLSLSFGDGFSGLQQPVGQSAFAVVDMGNDTEITDILHSLQR